MKNKKVKKILATLMISTSVLGSTGIITTSTLADEVNMMATEVADKKVSINLNIYDAGKSDRITGSYNGTNAVYMRAEVNGEKKQIVGSKELAQGKISYYIGNRLKSTDNVDLVLFDKNYKELGRQKLTIKDPVTTVIKLDTYVEGESSSITGSYNGTNAVYVRAEVNGKKDNILKSKELAEGKINYYIGKELRTSDNVEIVLFDKEYRELGRKQLKISTMDLIPDPKLKESINKQLGKSPDYNPQKQELQQMTSLHVPFSGITNLEGLEYCTNLEVLDLNGDQFSDITPIANLTKMKNLNIANNKSLSDISSLKNLTALENLDADYSNISDLTALSNMTQLKVLHIPFNPLKSLKGLENCKELTGLDLNGDQYSDITPIANLTKLKTLGIANNKNLTDISSLKNLTALENLYADFSGISDITALSNMTQLKVLHIPFNPLKSLNGLQNCKELTELDLNGDQYSDLTPIANLTKMKTLGIANDKNLSDISSLKNLTALVNLYLDNSNVSDISVLANLTNLRSLHIPGNPITNYDVLNGLQLTDLTK
ncbi:leucine-rich repeat domain-containing protein [Enterococcus hirae]|uniref:leucine-rich repeat domain-containing protein n=1 Tax=Enterococcus hirae TaxID=1354 RepID=UPI0039A5B1BA